MRVKTDNIIVCKNRIFFVLLLLAHPLGGCGHVADNYPTPFTASPDGAVHLIGEGFFAVAGGRLELDRIQADLGLLRAQGFSPRDPQILRDIARRERVPVGLVGKPAGAEFYRVRFRVAEGSRFELAPCKMTLSLRSGRTVREVPAEKFLIVEPEHPAGYRPVEGELLVLDGSPTEVKVLVQAGLRGEIVGLTLEPHLTRVGTP